MPIFDYVELQKLNEDKEWEEVTGFRHIEGEKHPGIPLNNEDVLNSLEELKNQKIRLKMLEVNDDEQPDKYLLWEISDWQVSGGRFKVISSHKNIRHYTETVNED